MERFEEAWMTPDAAADCLVRTFKRASEK